MNKGEEHTSWADEISRRNKAWAATEARCHGKGDEDDDDDDDEMMMMMLPAPASRLPAPGSRLLSLSLSLSTGAETFDTNQQK